MKRVVVTAVALVVAAVSLMRATTRLASADGQFRDIQDTSPWAQDSDGIAWRLLAEPDMRGLTVRQRAYEQATHHRRPPRGVTPTPATERSERRERERSGGA